MKLTVSIGRCHSIMVFDKLKSLLPKPSNCKQNHFMLKANFSDIMTYVFSNFSSYGKFTATYPFWRNAFKQFNLKFALLLSVCLFMGKGYSFAESSSVVGIKSNIIYDAILSPNIGIEIGVAPKVTLDLSGNFNLWRVGGHSWKHWQIQPEARYWLCQRFSGHFVGLETHVGQFNVGNINFGLNFLGTDFRKLRDRRYQGWQGGLGVTYGYAWILSKHWNFEAELGLGYSYTKFDVYPCANCGTKIESDKSHNYFGVTKVQLGIVYIF